MSELVAPATQIVAAQNVSAPEHVAVQNISAKNVLARNESAQETNAPLVEPVNAATRATPAVAIATPTTTPERPLFNRQKTALFLWIVFIGAAVTVSVWLAKSGRPIKIRRIAALEAVDNAVGRATEMGRSILFVPGIQDMDNIQTVAGLTMLGRVAKTAAEYDATIEVPTCRSLVMEAARDTVRASYLSAGRADGFSADRITYITDDQFGYVAHVVGNMVREKPATCFYMGCFFAESLIFSETGNAIGAIQIAGTAESSQLPFFVAACDYTLIGEEFFAASAYLSGEPAQLGTLRGQDIGKFAVGALITLGVFVSTILAMSPSAAMNALLGGLQKVLGG
ncbi:hypothetical protein LBMAG50_02940 [Phycisphaerae bacterium]|nr:hypothetical protein LBMAG50_02940 [Phycisphaerae bacterium]